MQAAAAPDLFLACYRVLDRSKAAVPVRITPPLVRKLTIQAVIDANHDISISGEQVPDVGVDPDPLRREMPKKPVLCTTGGKFTLTA